MANTPNLGSLLDNTNNPSLADPNEGNQTKYQEIKDPAMMTEEKLTNSITNNHLKMMDSRKQINSFIEEHEREAKYYKNLQKKKEFKKKCKVAHVIFIVLTCMVLETYQILGSAIYINTKLSNEMAIMKNMNASKLFESLHGNLTNEVSYVGENFC